eukprot:TRINITY_DN64846_c0_g1_i1.p1 TRINITY_DN64846_c0_g1~~TRINITY_DN64846_c0_g1_i1.p1  ORF type:complete len:223 (-),score=24.74 TRINITY_DN64846_c0_g1_i1:102-770(-)
MATIEPRGRTASSNSWSSGSRMARSVSPMARSMFSAITAFPSALRRRSGQETSARMTSERGPNALTRYSERQESVCSREHADDEAWEIHPLRPTAVLRSAPTPLTPPTRPHRAALDLAEDDEPEPLSDEDIDGGFSGMATKQPLASPRREASATSWTSPHDTSSGDRTSELLSLLKNEESIAVAGLVEVEMLLGDQLGGNTQPSCWCSMGRCPMSIPSLVTL